MKTNREYWARAGERDASRLSGLLTTRFLLIGALSATVEDDELSKAIKPTGTDSKEPRTMAPGAHAVVMMWLSLDASPDALKHRIDGTAGKDPEALIVESSAIRIGGTPVRLAPPLHGDRWLAANGPSNDTHHRRSWLAHEGRPLFPERFAIDFVGLYEDGLTHGNPNHL